MGDQATEKKDFDFTGIFPNCRNDYNNSWNRRWQTNYFYTEYSKVCLDYRNNIKAYNIGGQGFQEDCIALGLYLNNIKEKNESEESFYLEASCKYFFYKLKELVDKHKGNCNTTQECYELLIKNNEAQGVSRIPMPQVCQQYVNNNDVGDYIFKMLKNLDILYDRYNLFVSTKPPNKSKFDSFRTHFQYLDNHECNNSTTFRTLLENLNNSFIEYIKGLNPHAWNVSGFMHNITPQMRITGLLNKKDSTTNIDEVAKTLKIIGSDFVSDAGAQISIGLTFSFFAIF
ncbi:variable surface protein, partial [Plasmodium gonderi]